MSPADTSVGRYGKLCNPGYERIEAGELYGMRVRVVRLLSAWPFERRTVDQALYCRGAVRAYMRARRRLRARYGRDAITPGLRIPPRTRR